MSTLFPPEASKVEGLPYFIEPGKIFMHFNIYISVLKFITYKVNEVRTRQAKYPD